MTSSDPICKALIGPIAYSSTNKNSQRYAAPQLAPDLAVRNGVGAKLDCPAYKTTAKANKKWVDQLPH